MRTNVTTKSPIGTARALVLALTGLGLALLAGAPAQATPPALATAPLANATTTQVKPNLMFIMDNSGSMNQDYTPDYVGNIWDATFSTNERICRDSGDDDSGVVYSGLANGTTRVLDGCIVGDPPYMSPDINTQYYNPTITYVPAVNADGSSKPAQTSYSSVQTDAFGVLNRTQLWNSATTTDLLANYPDRLWCTKQSPSAAEKLDTAICRKNSDYSYPNATFKYGRSDGGSPNGQASQTYLAGVLMAAGAPYYYKVIPSEFCTDNQLKDCIASATATGAYTFPAYSRWCSDLGLTDCQSVRTSTYHYPRYVGVAGNIAATGWFDVSGFSSNKTFNWIKVGTTDILGGVVTKNNPADMAAALAAQINSYNSTPEYTATTQDMGGGTWRVNLSSTVAAGASANGDISKSSSSGVTFGRPAGQDVTGGVTAAAKAPYAFARVDIVPAVTSYPKAGSRTDCAGSTCSYTEEMTNFANWYAYYRTRFNSMKSSVSRAFKSIDSRYRVGYVTINNRSANFLKINDFFGTHKTNWYAKLFAAKNEGGTPLRSTLSVVGQMYAGRKPSAMNDDPVQYSCQQNFSLLTTDGYWNTDSDSNVQKVDGTTMSNQDNTADRPMYEGPTASATSLADVAMYYYQTDLRDSAYCTGALGFDVCENNVFISATDANQKQHMTTFTLGLGIDGTLIYQDDYKTAESGDYFKLKNGLGVDWPLPQAEKESAVDDLWHAAVNGRGTYFSAKNPTQLVSGLTEALSQINAKLGSSSAAATSTLTPVAGDNFVFLPTYTTVSWTGNVEARSVNTQTGAVGKTAAWCVENITGKACPAPGSIVSTISGSATTYQCVTPYPSVDDCLAPGVWDADNLTCSEEIPIACNGTMPGKVAVDSDTRKIYTAKGGSLADFTYGNLPASAFSPAVLSNLSQWSALSTTQQALVTGVNVVNYLRGQYGFEDRGSNVADNRIFRKREATLGDILESSPVHVAGGYFEYADSGYAEFKADKTSRAKTLYVGANDGMLHAFDATNGQERWAFVPSAVVANLWKLADKNYSGSHTNFVNGSPQVADICVAADCSTATKSDWRTILIGGLGSGGIGYYALDVTDPSSPSLLWEFGAAQDSNLGYSYGNPIVTKRADGKWVVLLTSGYYNKKDSSSPTLPTTGDGKGYLYVLDAKTGAKLLTIDTGVGTATNPAGLARISNWANYPLVDQTTSYIYGGDLLGNLWRFDINAASASDRVMKYAELRDGSGNPQPITVAPELGAINKKRVVFVATGKYIEALDLTTTQAQTIYAIQDAEGSGYATTPATTTFSNPRASSDMVKQTLTNLGDTQRTVTTNTVDWSNKRGWYADLPDTGERAHVDPRLLAGVLIVPSTVPENSICSPGGYGWVNYLDYTTGSLVKGNTIVAEQYSSPVVGVSAVYVKCEGCGNYKPVVIPTTADGDIRKGNIEIPLGAGKFQKKRLIWRELIPQ